jgi:hypothetical protein
MNDQLEKQKKTNQKNKNKEKRIRSTILVDVANLGL